VFKSTCTAILEFMKFQEPVKLLASGLEPFGA
jgi:hypothetical protein